MIFGARLLLELGGVILIGQCYAYDLCRCVEMTDEQAERERVALIGTLAVAESMLRKYGVTQWADFLERSRNLIEGRDFRGVEELFSIFGGMGSFNDVVIHLLNGNPISEVDIGRVNEQLQVLTSRIYESVTALRRYEYAR